MITAVLEAADQENKKYLSDDVQHHLEQAGF